MLGEYQRQRQLGNYNPDELLATRNLMMDLVLGLMGEGGSNAEVKQVLEDWPELSTDLIESFKEDSNFHNGRSWIENYISTARTIFDDKDIDNDDDDDFHRQFLEGKTTKPKVFHLVYLLLGTNPIVVCIPGRYRGHRIYGRS